MAHIVVKGIKKAHREDLSQYLYNLQRTLGIINLRSKTIYLTFKRRVDGDAMGYCSGDHKVVEIEIAKTGWEFEDIMIAVAHEMVHAKQFLRKELIDGYMYKGRNYWECSYEHQPWEKSAYLREMKLYNTCYGHGNRKNMHVSANKHCTFC